MNTKYEPGDIVKLVDPWKSIRHSLYRENLFKISSITPEGIRLWSMWEKALTIHDISPVKIDGIEDSCIYYDPVIAGSIILPGQPVPVHKKDYSYYIHRLEKCTLFDTDKTLKELVLEQNFSYVHELQHFLRERYHGIDDLKIHYTIL